MAAEQPGQDTDRAGVVAGCDGSADALDAVRWAAAAADRRHAPLTVVHVRGPDDRAGGAGRTETLLDDARAAALAVAPHLAVATDVVVGNTARMLVQRSADAALTVVGRRGAGRYAALQLGSTAAQLAAYAAGPVAVVPRGSTLTVTGLPGVVLAVDGSEEGRVAVEWAFAEAERGGWPLTAVRAVDWLNDGPGLEMPLRLPEALIEDQARVLSLAIAGTAAAHPDVPVRRLVEPGHPVRVLVGAAPGAAVVVAGARGTGGFLRLLLGSVGDGLIRHSPVPVVIAR